MRCCPSLGLWGEAGAAPSDGWGRCARWAGLGAPRARVRQAARVTGPSALPALYTKPRKTQKKKPKHSSAVSWVATWVRNSEEQEEPSCRGRGGLRSRTSPCFCLCHPVMVRMNDFGHRLFFCPLLNLVLERYL